MTKQITLEQALQLVSFKLGLMGDWQVEHVHSAVYGNVGGFVLGNIDDFVGGNVAGDVEGDVKGDVRGNVRGNVYGNVYGDVCRNVYGDVNGNIGGKKWQLIETPKEKLRRLIEKGADKEELLEAFNRLEQS